MDIICQKIAENFVILLSSWPCLDGNILTNGIKVIIYAYAHMIIDYCQARVQVGPGQVQVGSRSAQCEL